MGNYSIMLHQYIHRNAVGRPVVRYTFSVAKTFEGKDGAIHTRPLRELIAETKDASSRRALVTDLNTIGSRFTACSRVQGAPCAPEHEFPASS